ncbi:MAG: glutamyl-tRNA reductase [Pseudomonadota bacterium]
MTLLAYGINHKTADIALRERVAINGSDIAEILSELLGCNAISEAVVLSTCNRTEIYADGKNSDTLLEVLSKYCKLNPKELQDVCYCYQDQDMVRHVMRVACGLDSMVLGEPQIFGQLKTAVAIAQNQNALGQQLSRLFQQVFNVTKMVRTQSKIGACPISVASTAVSLAEDIFPDLGNNTALIIGAGETGALVAKHLKKRHTGKIMIAGRHLNKARQLASEIDGWAIELQQLNHCLAEADIVFSATASPTALLGKTTVENALKYRPGHTLLMIDIAVPRDIEAAVGELDNVRLYTIDDLKNIIALNTKSREHAATKAEEMIIENTKNYMQWLRSLSSDKSIRAFRSQVETLRAREIKKALKRLKAGEPAENIINYLANSLTNKLMHPPSVKLREASRAGRTEFIVHFNQLFDLDENR